MTDYPEVDAVLNVLIEEGIATLSWDEALQDFVMVQTEKGKQFFKDMNNKYNHEDKVR